jgi:hypothetical protein
MVTPISRAEKATANPSVPANQQLSGTSRAVLKLNLELQRQITNFKRNTVRTAPQPVDVPHTGNKGDLFALQTLVRNRPEAAMKLLKLFAHEMAHESHGLAKLCKALKTGKFNDLPTAEELTNDLANVCAIDSIPDKSLVSDVLQKLISHFIEPVRTAVQNGRTVPAQPLRQLASLSAVLLRALGKLSDQSVTTIGKLQIHQLDQLIGVCNLALETAHPTEQMDHIEAIRNILDRKRQAIIIVQTHPLALETMDAVHRNDRDVVLRAAHLMGWSLSFASEELKNDKEIVLAAVRQNGWVLGFASEAMRNDKVVVMAAVQNNGIAYQYASPELKNDREVAIAAVRNSQISMIYMGPHFQRDPEIRAIVYPRPQQH